MELVAGEFKLSAVELEQRDFQSADLAYLQELKSKLAACQLEAINLGLFNDYGKVTEAEREKEFEKFKKWVRIPRDAVTTPKLFQEVNQDNLRLVLDTGNYTDGIPSIEQTLHLAVLVHARFLKVDKEGNRTRH